MRSRAASYSAKTYSSARRWRYPDGHTMEALELQKDSNKAIKEMVVGTVTKEGRE